MQIIVQALLLGGVDGFPKKAYWISEFYHPIHQPYGKP